jgi:hypothetical protein
MELRFFKHAKRALRVILKKVCEFSGVSGQAVRPLKKKFLTNETSIELWILIFSTKGNI